MSALTQFNSSRQWIAHEPRAARRPTTHGALLNARRGSHRASCGARDFSSQIRLPYASRHPLGCLPTTIQAGCSAQYCIDSSPKSHRKSRFSTAPLRCMARSLRQGPPGLPTATTCSKAPNVSNVASPNSTVACTVGVGSLEPCRQRVDRPDDRVQSLVSSCHHATADTTAMLRSSLWRTPWNRIYGTIDLEQLVATIPGVHMLRSMTLGYTSMCTWRPLGGTPCDDQHAAIHRCCHRFGCCCRI